MELIDGKKISSDIKKEIAAEVAEMIAAGKKQPHLAAVLVGHDGGSETYVAAKVKACEECGFKSTLIRFEDDVTEEELLATVDKLNNDADIDGFIVQLPLPKHISEQKVIEAIDYRKDVDGFHPLTLGKLFIGEHETFISCTPKGIMTILDSIKTDYVGKHAVIVGRSRIVGKPISQILLKRGATVTICHSRTKDLKAQTLKADILVVAIGKADFVTADMVKPGAVVIDVGMNRKADGKLTGDVDYAGVSEVAGYITPVPGGVGPMTITMLLKNTLTAAKEQHAK